jgi:hypothetical protein
MYYMKKSKKILKGGSSSSSSSRAKAKSNFAQRKRTTMSAMEDGKNPTHIGCKDISMWKSIVSDQQKQLKKYSDKINKLEGIILRCDEEKEVYQIELELLKKLITNKENC